MAIFLARLCLRYQIDNSFPSVFSHYLPLLLFGNGNRRFLCGIYVRWPKPHVIYGRIDKSIQIKVSFGINSFGSLTLIGYEINIHSIPIIYLFQQFRLKETKLQVWKCLIYLSSQFFSIEDKWQKFA